MTCEGRVSDVGALIKQWSVGAVLLVIMAITGCSDSEVGDVSLGLFTTKDIKIDALVDPIVTGVTCHISSIEADLDFSDPSDSAIACRQTGPITASSEH